MTVDRQARHDLHNTIVEYMTGVIRSREFDDRILNGPGSSDNALSELTTVIWTMYDDFIDHPICVSAEDWEVLRRVLAFLRTDLEPCHIREWGEPIWDGWPFESIEQFELHEPLVDEAGLPVYDPLVHAVRHDRWWQDSVNLIALALVAGATLLFLVLLLR